MLLTLSIALLGPGCPSDAGESTETSKRTTAGDTPSAGARRCECDRPDSFAEAVDRVRPAVVNLYAAEPVREGNREIDRPGGRLRRLVPKRRLVRSLGSGLIVDATGLVVTNHHVVQGVETIRARLLDDRWFETRVLGSDPKTDLALLQLVDAEEVPSAPLGDSSDLEVGDWVVAIGNPLGLDSTVTVGIASGIGRSDLPVEGEMRYQDFIQTDASINPGNSGGPLVDTDGDVVGLNTMISAEAQGIGFAIPAAMIRRVLPRLEQEGRVERSWIGLYVDEVPAALRKQLDLAKSGGVLVTGVVEGGPADRAGFREGDVILELDGRTVTDVDEITWLAGNLPIDRSVEVVVRRGSERRGLKLTPASKPDAR